VGEEENGGGEGVFQGGVVFGGSRELGVESGEWRVGEASRGAMTGTMGAWVCVGDSRFDWAWEWR
jgi:hypothetical protein